MTFHRLLQKTVFDPEEISRIVEAYEDVLEVLGLNQRADPMTEIVAAKVIEVAQTGVLDGAKLKGMVLEHFGL